MIDRYTLKGMFAVKKQYEKPAMIVENYVLTQSIAACDIKIGFTDSNCVKNDPDATPEMKSLAWNFWFVSGSCAKAVVGGSDEDGICYHTNTNAAFNS